MVHEDAGAGNGVDKGVLKLHRDLLAVDAGDARTSYTIDSCRVNFIRSPTPCGKIITAFWMLPMVYADAYRVAARRLGIG